MHVCGIIFLAADAHKELLLLEVYTVVLYLYTKAREEVAVRAHSGPTAHELEEHLKLLHFVLAAKTQISLLLHFVKATLALKFVSLPMVGTDAASKTVSLSLIW
jgi:hypothetical protein